MSAAASAAVTIIAPDSHGAGIPAHSNAQPPNAAAVIRPICARMARKAGAACEPMGGGGTGKRSKTGTVDLDQ